MGQFESEERIDPAKLKSARNAATLTQKQLAECIGIYQGAVSEWERGKAQPRMENWKKLEECLSVKRRDLLLDGSARRESIAKCPVHLTGESQNRTDRQLDGHWRAESYPIPVPPYIEYAKSTRVNLATVAIYQRGNELVGIGKDHDKDPLHLCGNITDGGNFVYATYMIKNDQITIYGQLVVEVFGFKEDEMRMKGFFLGKDPGYETKNRIVFGFTELRRVADLADSESKRFFGEQ